MQVRRLGRHGPHVSALGLTCDNVLLRTPWDDGESLPTLHAAFDAEATLLDTADSYGTGRNETMVGRAVEGATASCRWSA